MVYLPVRNSFLIDILALLSYVTTSVWTVARIPERLADRRNHIDRQREHYGGVLLGSDFHERLQVPQLDRSGRGYMGANSGSTLRQLPADVRPKRPNHTPQGLGPFGPDPRSALTGW